MKTLLLAILSAALTAGATGCCCLGGGCSPCGSCGMGGATYGYAPAYTPSYGGCNSCGPSYGGCPNGNCGVGAPYVAPQGVYPQGSYYGPTDLMQASAMPAGVSPIAMNAPYAQTSMSPGYMQTAMAPLQSLPTY